MCIRDRGLDGSADVIPLDEHTAQQLHPAVEQGDLPQLLFGQDAVGPVQPGQQQGDIIVAAVVAHKHTGSVFGDVVQPLSLIHIWYGEDRNGDGKVLVTLNVYTLDYSGEDPQTESAAYLTMAGTTKLATDVQGGLSSIFLLYDPAGFEDSTGTLRYLDGSLPAPDSDDDWWNMAVSYTHLDVYKRQSRT